MPQGNQSIANTSFPTTRSNINAELSALYSMSSGTGFPAITIAGMLCYRTDLNAVYQRNAADSGWNFLFATTSGALIDQSGSAIFATTTGSSNAYVVTLSPAITAYTTGMMLNLKLNFSNTGAATVNVSGLGAKTIKKAGTTTDVATGDLANNSIVQLIYDGTNFQVCTPSPVINGKATTTDIQNGSTLNNFLAITPNALGALWIQGSLTAANALSVASPAGYYVVSGSTNITSISYTAVTTPINGQKICLRFSGAPLISNSASLILPGGVDIQAASGDYAEFVLDTGNWRCITYMRGGLNTVTPPGLPTGYHGTANPVYATSTTATVAYIRERSADDTQDLIKTGSTTLNIANTGLNGIARSSANLTGTIAYSNSSASVTGSSTTFTTDYVAGETIWDQTNSTVVGTIKTINSDTSITLYQNFSGTGQSGASHRRGSRAMQSIWYLYAITNGSTVGLILSNRDVSSGDTLVDLPSGYATTTARQIPFAMMLDTTATPVILPFNCFGEGINTRYIEYQAFEQSSVYRALNAGTATSFTGVSLKPIVPRCSQHVKISYLNTYSSASGISSFRPTGSGVSSGEQTCPVIASTITTASGNLDMRTDANQSIDYKMSNAGSNVSVFVKGFWVEVP